LRQLADLVDVDQSRAGGTECSVVVDFDVRSEVVGDLQSAGKDLWIQQMELFRHCNGSVYKAEV
jgi:hypothetical protein